ncbi:hypothetical protein LAZ67_16001159 [Cordylochernes scorpioides]|uniref:Reverse transcriptase n=1 Tax=Cordylochernes scorpioides TaxID=51811 RepID=A0ABY6LFY5_9ARAC|nr:hypothetical protein LAZ67_16001159 [Cordylochernes scorpioides]
MSSSKPSGSKTKRKIADEHKNFQEKWELEYFCSEVKDKIICLICNNAISVPKLYNIKRHYEQHKSKYDTYEGLMRQEKLKDFKLGMKKQQFMFTKVSQESEAAVHASYVLSEMIAKHSKPFTEGDFIKECLIKAAEIVCPGSVKTGEDGEDVVVQILAEESVALQVRLKRPTPLNLAHNSNLLDIPINRKHRTSCPPHRTRNKLICFPHLPDNPHKHETQPELLKALGLQIIEENSSLFDITIYTDGSQLETGLSGSGIAIYKDKILEKISLSHPRHLSVYKSELSAIDTALKDIDINSPSKIIIYSDSRAAIYTLQSCFPVKKPLLKSIAKSVNRLPANSSVTVQSLPAHFGIPGNELADSLAKAGALGLPEARESTTQLDERDLLHTFKTQCLQEWKSNAAHDWYRAGGTSTGSVLPREQQSLIFRLKSGHLQTITFQNGFRVFPLCTKCNSQPATPRHIIDCIDSSIDELYSSPADTIKSLKLDTLVFLNDVSWPDCNGSPDNQFGFVHGRTAEEALAKITQFIDERQSHWRKTLTISLDISKAFDTVWRPAIIQGLERLACPHLLICLVQSFLEDRKVSFSAWTATAFTFSQLGTPQGSVLSPFLWNIIARFLFIIPPIRESLLVAYADDFTLMTQVRGRLPTKAINIFLDKIASWSTENGLELNPRKIQVCIFQWRRVRPNPDPGLIILGQPIPISKTIIILGLEFDQTRDLVSHLSKLIRRCRAIVPRLTNSIHSKFGISYAAGIRILQSVVIPALLYGVSAWGRRASSKEGTRQFRSLYYTFAKHILRGVLVRQPYQPYL